MSYMNGNFGEGFCKGLMRLFCACNVAYTTINAYILVLTGKKSALDMIIVIMWTVHKVCNIGSGYGKVHHTKRLYHVQPMI